MKAGETTRQPASNRLIAEKYPNVLDFIEARLKAELAGYAAMGDEASLVIYQDILNRYMAGDVLVTFVDGDTYYAHAIATDVNDNNDLTGSQ
tara:strand:+ start:495 stop:770 length:276 start_codon:yes stop_codon:yes gene_type:complete